MPRHAAPMALLAEPVPGVHVVDTVARCAVVTGDRTVLVDAGDDADATRLLEALERLKLGPGDLDAVVVTHCHPDHVLGLAAVCDAYDAEVAAHAAEAAYVAKEAVPEGPPDLDVTGHTAVPVDVELADGETYAGLEVVHTPGHTPGHIVLRDADRGVVIAGDALQADPDYGPIYDGLALGPMDDRLNLDPDQHRASIRKLAGLDFDTLVLGHGDPIVGDAAARVRELADAL